MSDHLDLSRDGSTWMLSNPSQVENIHAEQFDLSWWESRDRLTGSAPGRGTSAFLNAGDREWVLRHFRRGGLLANLLKDQYVWMGAENSRAFRELRLLELLWNAGLPVPEPVAARVQRSIFVYQADLLTVRIPGARPFADVLGKTPVPHASWRVLGALLARFHREGVFHHDLNARNILLDDDGAFWLIDFDRCGIRKPGRWCGANLSRLHRSLEKFVSRVPGFNFVASDWQALRAGYLASTD